ncbi:MAG: type III-B CRISPR-associated protein Cas10/Cmr2 [Deltaproteobacteria bacterium]|nr:type III-B CRISPR-associated protein Cas10/Cmr2 [Deltaproteobacteria bacterium]|tara:strand:- start:6538 stop:8736 length:2199 start_codon:yes stop_codon:yes gene_type:complete
MKKTLLLIAIGPVQEFIAQARRSRDLWFGSHLLSELSRAAASAIARFPNSGDHSKATVENERLIFPAFKSVDEARSELVYCPAPYRNQGEPPRNIANKLLAVLPTEHDGSEVAKQVREAVFKRWRMIANECFAGNNRRITALIEPSVLRTDAQGCRAAWDEQIDTFLEFYAVWSSFGAKEYVSTLETLERELFARKHLKDFSGWQHQRGNVPKSSLDGARDTVLVRSDPTNRDLCRARHQYRISDGEQLDAIGLIKRTGGEPGQFIPLAYITIAHWLLIAQERCPDALHNLQNKCEELDLGAVDSRFLFWERCPCYRADAQVFFEDRWRSIFIDKEGVDSQKLSRMDAKSERFSGTRLDEITKEAKDFGRDFVLPILEKNRSPYPYVACLVADGDKMGSCLKKLTQLSDSQDSSLISAHQNFSQILSRFATDARRIVQEEHKGALIYAGGDDVLAFLPLQDVLSCALKLKDAFKARMKEALPQTQENEHPTLSVGIGIGHFLENMGHLLKLGRRAEVLAKGKEFASRGLDRDALAIILDKRSGGISSWRSRWGEKPTHLIQQAIRNLQSRPSKVSSVDEVVGTDDTLLTVASERQGFPSTKLYELRELLLRLPKPRDVNEKLRNMTPDRQAEDELAWSRTLQKEVGRVISKAGTSPGKDPDKKSKWTPALLGLSFEGLEEVSSEEPSQHYRLLYQRIENWLQRMLIARVFVDAQNSLEPKGSSQTPDAEGGE